MYVTFPFFATGDADNLAPNVGTDEADLGDGVFGETVLLYNASAELIHFNLEKETGGSAAATDAFIAPGLTMTIKREESQRYLVAYSAADASTGGLWVIAGQGV